MFELIYPIDCEAPLLPSATISKRTSWASSMEILPVIEECGVVIGRASRSYCHSGSHLLHPVVHLHIVSRDEKIYLQKRSVKKDIMPGRWDTAVGGHVLYGESVAEALARESQEELNFAEYNPIYLGSYKWDTDRDSEYVNIFAAVGSFPQIRPDKDEVEEGKWWSVSQIDAKLGSGIFTENFVTEYKQIKKSLLALL